MVSMFYADTLPCYATGQLDVCLVTQMQCGDRELPEKLIEHDESCLVWQQGDGAPPG